jgi:transposase
LKTNSILATFATQFLLLPADLHVEEVVLDKKRLILVLSSRQLTAVCPFCSSVSARVHSHYTRTLVDLPCQERAVVLRVQVRRFFCLAAACAHQTFAEQFPVLAPAYARRTHRQLQRLRQIAFALGGRPGARLLKQQDMPTSFSSLVRLIRHSPAPHFPSPHVLGIDDFALKKGERYGTILVDLERHRPIDVLPDREAATVIAWLKAHPEINIVSRDRASVYAQAVKKGAPHAQQVADRWHLLANLRETILALLKHKRTSLPTEPVEQADPRSEEPQAGLSQVTETLVTAMETPRAEEELLLDPESQQTPFKRDTAREKCFHAPNAQAVAQSQISRAKSQAVFKQVQELHHQGLSIRTIARSLGLSRQRVRRYLQVESLPETTPRRRSPIKSKLDPFVPYVLKRWNDGEFNGTQLYREIHDHGYSGSRPLLGLLIADLRRMLPPPESSPRTWMRKGTSTAYPAVSTPRPPVRTPPQRRLTPREVSWLYMLPPEQLTEQQQSQLRGVCQAGSDLQQAYELTQEFVAMLKQRKVSCLESWLKRTEQSGLAAFKGFARGLRRDEAAVSAALSSAWSQGQVEGQITRLKLLKRHMYGRAKFDLLRLRVLHAA